MNEAQHMDAGLFFEMKMKRNAFLFFLTFSFSVFGQQQYEIRSITFRGNEQLKADQLRSVILLQETPSGFWKFIYRHISEAVGQKPEYFDPVVFAADYSRLKQFYQNKGFFHVSIDTSLQFSEEEYEVSITYDIIEGKRSLIDTIHYSGLEELPHQVQKQIFEEQQIKQGNPYELENVEKELRRVVTILANSGYVNAKVIRVEAVRYASTNNFTIYFTFQPGERYRFGNIEVVHDTTGASPIDKNVILRHLDFKQGDYYSEEKKLESERNLNRLGVFDASRIENLETDNVSEIHVVPIRVTVRTRPFQELAPEVGISDENNAFNVSFGVGYSHRNLFGGAQNFSTTIRTSIQSIHTFSFKRFFSKEGLKDSSLVAKIDLSIQFLQPYFFNNRTSLRSSISWIIDKQRAYYLPVYRLQTGMVAQTATYTKVFLDWNLEYSNPTALATQTDTVIGLYQKQLNSILTFTIQRDKRNDVFYPSSGFFHSLSIEEAGTLPRSIGPLFKNTLPFSQYIKTSVLGYWYWDPTKKNKFIWALKGKIGTAFLYGHAASDLPLTQRFFAGGSGSMRGWRARSLGVVERQDLGGKALIESSLEGRWNPLQDAGSFWFIELSKFSFVAFTDVGNMWSRPADIRLNDLAVDFGFGIRYNTIAGPIRIDFGMRIFDPDEKQGRQWIYQKRFFKETISTGVIHLGVGHTF